MNLARLAIRRPTFITSILMAVLILGVVSFTKLSVRMFPDVEFPYVAIMTTYSGAGVNEIEHLVSKPVEDAVSGVSGVKHLTSINLDNISIVFAEFELTKNPDVAAQEVRDRIGQIRRILPDDVEEPIIMKVEMDMMPLMIYSLKADGLTPKQLYDFADDIVSKDLAQVGGVSQIQLIGGQKREIQVNADKRKLKEYELTLTALAARISANSLNIPAGKVDRGAKEINYRTMGEFPSVKKINDVVVSFVGNDVPVTVKDVATVVDGVAIEQSRARLNVKDEDGNIIYMPSMLVQVFRQAKGNDVAISDGLQKKVADLNKKYKKFAGSPQLTMISDNARGVRMNLKDVQETILEGIFLAIVVVYFFLGSWRSTFITALALPNSLIGSFVFMYAFGFSLNVISLMSLSLAVGLLIDDAIVVRENIFRHYEEGSDPVTSAVEGTNEVMLAVIATTSTVIAVFFPVAFLSGIMGKFFKEFGLTVVFAMFISVLDALTIAPMLSAYIIPNHSEKNKKRAPGFPAAIAAFWGLIVKGFRLLTVVWFNALFRLVEICYIAIISFIVKKDLFSFTIKSGKKVKEVFVKIIKYKFVLVPIFVVAVILALKLKASAPSLSGSMFYLAAASVILFALISFFDFGKGKVRFAVSWKFMTLVIAALIFFGSLAVAKKYLQTTFMPNAEWGEFNVGIEAKPGVSLERMDKYSKEIETIIMEDPDVELVSASVGGSNMFVTMSNTASIYVKMVNNESKGGILNKIAALFKKSKDKPGVKKNKTTSQMKDYLREVLGKKYGNELEISINNNGIGGGNRSEFVFELIGADIDVLYKVAGQLRGRYKEIPYLVDLKSNYKIGKPEIQIQFDTNKMEQMGVSSVMVGNEVRAMIDGAKAGKFRDKGLEYDIVVRLQENQKDITENFGAIYVNNVNNKLVKLQNVARPVEESAPTRIFRKDRTRYITVEGNVAKGGAIGEIQKQAVRIFNEEKSKPENEALWRNIEYRTSGNAEEMATMFQSIIIAFGLSLAFIFMVLASLYESIITPFTIMTALPLAIVGGIIALLLSNQPIDMFTMIGMIMLMGIVAKNSILLVDYIQQMRRKGMAIDDSIVKAGSIRLRPILMTSFALIAGMLPTALGLSEVGQFRRGMGIVVIGGIISSTILTLIVVPSIYEYMDMIRCFLRRLLKRPPKRMMDYTEEQLEAKGL